MVKLFVAVLDVRAVVGSAVTVVASVVAVVASVVAIMRPVDVSVVTALAKFVKYFVRC